MNMTKIVSIVHTKEMCEYINKILQDPFWLNPDLDIAQVQEQFRVVITCDNRNILSLVILLKRECFFSSTIEITSDGKHQKFDANNRAYFDVGSYIYDGEGFYNLVRQAPTQNITIDPFSGEEVKWNRKKNQKGEMKRVGKNKFGKIVSFKQKLEIEHLMKKGATYVH